jgi:hypothetical protein
MRAVDEREWMRGVQERSEGVECERGTREE